MNLEEIFIFGIFFKASRLKYLHVTYVETKMLAANISIRREAISLKIRTSQSKVLPATPLEPKKYGNSRKLHPIVPTNQSRLAMVSTTTTGAKVQLVA